MRLRSWLEIFASRHVIRRRFKGRSRTGHRHARPQPISAYSRLVTETLEPRQLLTSDPLFSAGGCEEQCLDALAAANGPQTSTTEPTWQTGITTGNVASSSLTEISGIVASRQNSDVLWVHNDSGDSARIFAMNTQGDELGVYNLSGAGALDWEDIAIGPGPLEGQDYLYVGDFGDNARARSSITVYRLAEPVVDSTSNAGTINLSGAEALHMQYPDTVYDCETLMVDPIEGDLYLVTKDRAGENMAHVFRTPADQTAGSTVTLEFVESLAMSSRVTGGDISPDGTDILIRQYHQAYYWSRDIGDDLGDVFAGNGEQVPLKLEMQGEAIGFSSNDRSYFSVSEGIYQPIHYYQENHDPGSISGYKWHDADGDSQWDAGEAGLSGWTIYVDANENGGLDAGETSTTTDENGFYRFENLQPGSYTIGEVLQSGWMQTFPDSLGGDPSSSSMDASTWNTPEILVGAEYSDQQLIVKLQDQDNLETLSSLRNLQASLGGTTLQSAESLGFELWAIAGDVKEAIGQWGDDPSFQYIQPNYTITVDATIPDDSRYHRLWGLNNTGQTGGTPDADIDAAEAWDLQTGSDIVVGIIDTGIDYTHPDLIDNIWTNPGEIAGNGVDDDGNGYIDDVHGYDFAYGDSDPMDGHSHGTHVAGTIAASGNNAQGVVGVNWNAQLMALKFLSDSGSGSTMNAILAVEYATMMGVRVTNNSWGGGGYSQALYNAIAAAGEADSLFIAAAGNSGSDNDASPHYPSNYDLDNIISVASTTHNDAISSFSSYGATTVDLGAPGSGIYSTVPDNNYASYSGTSMATPHVAGVVAMVMAEDPNLTAAQVKQVILGSVDPIPALDGVTVSGGRLNAYNALSDLGIPGTHTVQIDWNQDLTEVNFGGYRPNQRPSFPDTSFTIAETSVAGTIVGSFLASDPEQDSLSYSIVGNVDGDSDGNAAFRVEGDQLLVNDPDDLDYETSTQLVITAEVSDGGRSDAAEVTVHITDVNEAPSGVVLANAATSLPEDTDTTSAVKLADIQITDDALGSNTVSLTGADAASFEVIGTELCLKAGTGLDFTLQTSYSVTVNVEDSSLAGSTPVTAELVLAITPPGSANLSLFAYDTSANQLVNGTFEGSGVSNNSWGHVAAISGWTSSNGVEVWGEGFANYATSGRAGTGIRGQLVELDYYGGGALDWLEQGVATNAGAEYLVLVDVLSRTGSGVSDDMELSWNGTVFDTAHTSELAGQSWQSYGGLVTGSGGTDALRLAETAASNDGYGPVIDNARVYQATSPTVDEGLPGETVVTNIHLSTVDGVAYTNLRLSHDAGGLFTLDADTGVIRTTRSLDFDSDPSSYQLTVAVDTAGGTLTKTLSVGLNEINQAPTAVTLTNVVSSLAEDTDTSSRIKLADLQITDDAIGTNDVTLSGPDAASFEVDGTELYLKAGTGLDRDSQASYAVTVNVEDSSVVGSTPVTVAHTLAITDVNEAPTDVALANTVTALPEDTDTTSAVKLADIVIADDGHAGSNNAITLSGSDATSFEVDGTELNLKAGTGLDRDSQTSYSVTVNVEDSTVSGSTPVTVDYTLAITNVNDSPSGTVVISGTATEDQVLTASNNLTDGDGLGAISYHWNRDGSAIDGATGSTYTLTQADVGAQITVTASYTDGEGTPESVTSDPTSAVADINDAPTGVVLANTVSSLPEDTDTTSAVKLADIVIADDGHAGSNNVITLSGSDATRFEVVGTELCLKAGTGLDFALQASYSVTVNVEDSTVSGSTPVTVGYTLAITNVNDSPSGTVVISGTATEDQVLTASNNLTDGDGLGAISYQWNRDGSAIDGATGSTYTLTQADVGAQITVTASYTDGEGTPESVTSDPTSAVADINDAPTGVVLANTVASLAEDTDTTSAVKLADIVIADDGHAGSNNVITLSGSDATRFEVVGTELCLKAGTGLDRDSQASYSVTVNVEDSTVSGSTPVTAELVLAITPPGSANLSLFTYDTSANQLVNGALEGSGVSNNSWGHVAAISGWTSSNGVEVWGEGFANYATSGRAGTGIRGQLVELDYYGGGALDWIEQGVATGAGAEYLVLVDVLSRTGSGASDDMELSWNGTVFDTAHTSELAGQSWQSYGGLVTGSGGTDALRLAETAASNDGYGPVIDNARVYQATSPTVDEGLPGETVVTNIHLSTVDGVAYTNLRLSHDAGGLFTLDADTGVIRTTRSLDFDSDPSSYQLTVAVDTAGGTLTKTLSVGLNEITTAPRGSAYRAMQQASQEQGFSRASLEATPAGRSLATASALDYATHVSDTGTLSTAGSTVAGSTVALSTVAGSTVALSSPGTADLAFGSDDLDDIFSALEDDWQQAFGSEGENPFTGF